MSKRKRRSRSERETVSPLKKNKEEEVKNEVKEVKENLSKVSEDVGEVKVTRQMLENPSPTEEMMNIIRDDILITGGYGTLVNTHKTTEIYSCVEKRWCKMDEMNNSHIGATSFICGNKLFILGGSDSKTIETLDLNELPLRWMEYHELPYECGYHQTVVHEQRIIHIGGYNFREKVTSKKISQLQLSAPCTMEELCQMPEPRGHHGAEIFEDKVLIFGGTNGDGALDSVLEFNVKKNQCKEMPPLLHALWDMATILWRDKVVVLGGLDKHDRVLNDVFMYGCQTGEITAMPPMLEKRCGCCAVITGNTIAVMGGLNEKRETLKSVECFPVEGSTWEYLPAMNNARNRAIAEVLPSTRKYV